MQETKLGGVDPGLVHTGLVMLHVRPAERVLDVQSAVIDGVTPLEHADRLTAAVIEMGLTPENITIEAYRSRANAFSTDTEMRDTLRAIQRELPGARTLDNTGVRKVVRISLMRQFGLSGFPTTHHQDLESAARILLYGALKDPDLNRDVLTPILVDSVVHGRPWQISQTHL